MAERREGAEVGGTVETGKPCVSCPLDITKKPKSRSHSSKSLHSKPGKVFLGLSQSHSNSNSGSLCGGNCAGIRVEEFREGPCAV